MSDLRFAGGCQCGAVRFALHKMPHKPCICHCRMCQKAAGNLFGAFAGVDIEFFELTRGEITWWVSSSAGERGFCRDCGTPLAWRPPEHDYIAMTTGSFDQPEVMRPIFNYGAESMLPWLHEVIAIPATVTGASGPQVKASDDPHYERIHQTNRQHPDHDTAEWPPRN